MFKNISLIIKHKAELPRRVGELLESMLRGRGIEVTRNSVSPECEAVVVLGGDGTLLHIAGTAYQLGIPLLGINLGGLGFLTEIHLDEMEKALDSLLSGKFSLDERMMLAVSVTNEKASSTATYYALNEAVVTKSPLSRIVNLHTWAGNSFLTTYRGDGLIVSTPTGSTAYNLSAGGPILHPSLEAIVLTPICPFALSARPLLLNSHMEITIQIPVIDEEISLVLDGQVNMRLHSGDRILIKRAEGYLKLIRSPFRDYFTILREKLGWTTGVGLNT